jgi:hypothetical protein
VESQQMEIPVSSKPVDQVKYETQEKFEFVNDDQVVKNRLTSHSEFWEKTLYSSELVLSTIKYGYVIPFVQDPPPKILENNKSAFNNDEFVVKAINELLCTGCIVEVTDIPFVVNPLTVSISEKGKQRLVLDLRHVNEYVLKEKIKFEGINEAKNYAKKGYYMIKFDLRSGYHHVNIHPEHQKFLGFSWKINGVQKYFIFTVLPFGLSSAGHIFTKIMRTLVNYWRSQSFPIIVYLDDGWVCASKQKCTQISESVLATLLHAGFVPNYDKSVFTPTQKIEWLGFIWNLQEGVIQVPHGKITNIADKINAILSKHRVTARNLASILGKIISLIPAFGNVCQLMTRHLCMTVCQRLSWDSHLRLSSDVIAELEFWLKNCKSLPNMVICPISKTPERIIFSDASAYASAGFLQGKELEIVHNMFSESEQHRSSTWREMKSVQFILESFQNLLAGKLVKIYSDNLNVVQISRVGSMKYELQRMAVQMYEICIKKCISVEMEWIPRTKNVQADYLSRIFDFDDWSINQDIFLMCDKKWGPFTFDRFANDKNKKVEKFNSRFWVPGTCGVDAFAFDWSSENNWIVPPVLLISRVINHIMICKAKGVLIAPKWKSALFWPLLWNDVDKNYHTFVKDILEFKRPTNFFKAGSDKGSIFAKSPFITNILILKIDCSNDG